MHTSIYHKLKKQVKKETEEQLNKGVQYGTVGGHIMNEGCLNKKFGSLFGNNVNKG